MDKPTQKQNRFRANRQVLVFVGCVLLATFIWFINALSKQYTTLLHVPITYKNLPAQVVKSKLPDNVAVLINGKGFDLMQFSTSKSAKSLIIDCNQMPPSVFSGSASSINMVNLLTELNKTSRNGIIFESVTPEIIKLNASERKSKKIPVRSLVTYSYKRQFASKGTLILQPDSIYISGDRSALAAISQVTTEIVDFQGLDKTLFRSVRINKVDSLHISYSNDKVWAYLKVEPFTEGSISIPVTVENSGMKQITLVPDMVTINYHVTLGDYKNIRAEQFEATVSTSGAIINNKLKVHISRKPHMVSIVNIKPVQVDFFIQQK